MSRVLDDPIAGAREALDRHAWSEALDLLQRADGEGSLQGPELELLAQAAWWAGRMDDCISAKERAFNAYLEAGEPRRAGVVALQLVRDHGMRLNSAVAGGWFKRAERLLENEQASPEYGWLLLMRARDAYGKGDFEAADRLGLETVEHAARNNDADLQALGLMYQGMAEVARGDVDAGFGYLDEATVAAVGGELSPYITGVVYCNTISTCAEIGDYRRAGEWTDAAKRWCDRQSISGFPGVCRVHRAEIMRLRGWWADAEKDARQASTELMDHGLPALAAEGFNELGVIRMRMSDFGAAEDAFLQAHELGHDPEPGLALLRLAQGKPDVAAGLIRRSLEESDEPLRRARLLPACVEIAVAAGELEPAEEAAQELDRIAEAYGSDLMRAAAACAHAMIEIASGDGAAGLQSARRGWRLWQELEAPYEAAMARVSMGLAYRASGDEDGARSELRAAMPALERLGATADARRVGDLLGDERAQPAGRRVARTFLFSDIVRSTNLVEAIGDEAWEDLVGWHDRTLRAVFSRHAGEEVDHAGDGFFVAFADAAGALTAAVEIQRALASHRREHGFAPQVRIGLHLAEATAQDGDYRGRGVHEAARIGALAEGGEILASEATVQAAGPPWEGEDARDVPLKGISQPVRVASVRWREGNAAGAR
jgi:class 3 adenylate cyclase